MDEFFFKYPISNVKTPISIDFCSHRVVNTFRVHLACPFTFTVASSSIILIPKEECTYMATCMNI